MNWMTCSHQGINSNTYIMDLHIVCHNITFSSIPFSNPNYRKIDLLVTCWRNLNLITDRNTIIY